MANWSVGYRTNDEDSGGIIGTSLDNQTNYRLRVRYNSGGSITITLINLDTDTTEGSYSKSDASGLDIAPVKLLLGTKKDKSDNMPTINIKKIVVK